LIFYALQYFADIYNNLEVVYCAFDSSAKSVEIKRIEYDVMSAKKKIAETWFPDEPGPRLALG
jgi:hypothetical protein